MRDEYTEEISAGEPEDYRCIVSPKFRECELGDGKRGVGFCVNSPGAAGYQDKDLIWVADQLVDPVRVIEVCIHECLHAIFPKMSEPDVTRAGVQIAKFIEGVYRVKGTAPLPELRPLLTRENAVKLFPDLVPRDGVGVV